MAVLLEISPTLSGNQLVQALNDRLRQISFLLTTLSAQDGQTAQLHGNLDLGGGQILNVGAGGDVVPRSELQTDGLLLNPTSGTHIATRPIEAKAGVRIPRATRSDEAVRLDQVDVQGSIIPANAAPPAVANNSVLGAVTSQYALEDHTHSGMDLTTEQSSSAVKHFNGGLSIGVSGATIAKIYYASATWDPPNILTGTSAAVSVTVSGASLGNVALASFSIDIPARAVMVAGVSSANTVRVQIMNLDGVAFDLGSGTVKVWVLAFS